MRDNIALAQLLARELNGDTSRREFFRLLIAAGLLPIALKGSAYAAEDILSKPLNFMDSFYTLNNDYFNQMDAGANAAAAILNITETRELNNGDVNVQKSHVENAPNLGINGITMVAATEGSEIDLLRLVNQLQIPTVNNHTKAVWNTPLDSGDYYVAFHAPPNVTATRARSAQVFKKLGGKGKVVYIEGILGNPVEVERGHGFDLALKDFPDIELVARRPGGWSRTTTAPVIATLGIGFSYSAFPIAMGIPRAFTQIAIGRPLFGIPNPVFVMVIVLAVLWIILNKTEMGQRMQAVGSNIEAARLSGIRVDRVKMFAFAVAGFCAALTGVLLTSLLGSGTLGAADGYLLDAFAAVFLGSATLREGQFHILGTLVGVLVLAVGFNGLSIFGAPTYFQPIFKGGVLVLAVGLSTLASRYAARA